MPAVNFHLDNVSNPGGLYAIEKGATFDFLTLNHPLDLSSWTPCGEIRRNYLHAEANEVFAEFNFQPLVYGAVTLQDGTTQNRTIIRPYLTDEQTSLIPVTITRTKDDRVIVGRNAWVYDIKLRSPTDEVMILVKGFVQVVPDVSLC